MRIFTLQNLGIAYRKAKVDLYYSRDASRNTIADYEENLYENLSVLLKKLKGDDESWATQKKFTGTWTMATKSINMDGWKKYREKHDLGLIFSSPAEEWEHACTTLLNQKEHSQKPQAEFRVMSKCSMDFHVLSTLWILKVGHLFDAQLSRCAYGNRLRRTHDGKNVNPLSLGSFQPYLKPFCNWRDKGIDAMRTALKLDRRIVALTADISSFYHELNPGFMLDPTFVKGVLNLDLTKEQEKLNRLFIRALQAWSHRTPLKKGLPVGLPASAVVANAALVELDRCIERQVAPIYYGRYVDDILLVMENGANFRSIKQLWEWIFARSEGILNWEKEGDQVSFQPPYLKQGEGKSQIHFSNGKNKMFLLEGESGNALVEAIDRQIRERASEWRAMPRLPHSVEHVGTDLLAATQSDGEAADNLRKADALTIRRAEFAIKLRDFEAYERALLPADWEEHRRAFFHAFVQYVLVLPQFFDLSIYLFRVVCLATACEDFADLRKILEALERICQQVCESCDIQIKAWEPPTKLLRKQATVRNGIIRWKKQLFSLVRESIAASFPPSLSKTGKNAWQMHMADYKPLVDIIRTWPHSSKDFQALQARLFSFDLAHIPFRFIGLPKEMIRHGISRKWTIINCSRSHASKLLPEKIIEGNEQLIQWLKYTNLPHGLLFATRPFSLSELFILHKNAYTEPGHSEMQKIVLSLRGFRFDKEVPVFDKCGILQIRNGNTSQKHKRSIAVSSWKTHAESWTAAIMRMSDPDVDRYSRLCRLLDGVIAQPHRSSYLILPELAVPAPWFVGIASKIQKCGISLIAGIEYLHAAKSRVRNQVWAALSYDGFGFPSMLVYCQDKQQPALHEEQELQRLNGLEMKPERPWKTPPIIQHGDFRFALLICSELTNINYRTALRGQVDALFVLEWNRDTESFNALVESAALDMHAYIIQCNDREYGDSRIRAPFKDGWKRDILRVKGGVTDYCVIGEIDIHALRQFQSSKRSPEKPFKPVPDGFQISYGRKVLPARMKK